MPRSPDLLFLRTFIVFGIACFMMTPLVPAAEVVKIETDTDTPVQPINLSPDGPDIVLIEPKEGGTYTSPIGINITFRPENGTTVDLETLKVTVVSKTAIGVIESDITQDIVPYASAEGIQAPKAEIPAGEHVVTIQVADTAERTAERQLSIIIREESVLERRAKE